MSSRIIYTETDEAPALATYSFLPIVQAFTGAAGIQSLWPQLFHQPGERPLGNRLAVETDSLSKVVKMGRRVEPGVITGGVEGGITQGRGAALSFCSGHMDGFRPPVGVAQPGHESLHPAKVDNGFLPGAKAVTLMVDQRKQGVYGLAIVQMPLERLACQQEPGELANENLAA